MHQGIRGGGYDEQIQCSMQNINITQMAALFHPKMYANGKQRLETHLNC